MELDPGGYPWSEPPRGGVLTTGGLVDAPAGDLAGRVPVVAVGSNASPTVLARKLGGLLGEGLPVAVARVEGLVVGHSAHVSARGYVAAAPARGDGARQVTVGWFDERQLAALDATEPNYRRTTLPEDMECRAVDGTRAGPVVVGAQAYASLHGVLGERGSVLPLGTQAAVLEWLSDRLPGVGRRLTHARLAREDVRERVRTALAEAGLVVPAGLGDRR